jgi:signal recognition particle subunit SRP54
MLNMGGVSGIMSFMPGATQMKKQIDASGVNNKVIARQLAVILSMTKKERKNVTLLNASRRRRIANGAGVQVSEVNKVVKQFEQMQKLVKQMSRLGTKNFMAKAGQMLPPGLQNLLKQ